MRTKLGYLILGLAMGIACAFLLQFISDGRFTNHPKAAALAASPHIETYSKKPGEPAAEPSPAQALELVTGPAVAAPINRVKPESPSQKKELENSHGLRLDEEIVERLEAQRDSIRTHAYAEQREDGWKIHILAEDRALLSSGLKNEDVITHDSLNSQFKSRESSDLAIRFVAVLRYLER